MPNAVVAIVKTDVAMRAIIITAGASATVFFTFFQFPPFFFHILKYFLIASGARARHAGGGLRLEAENFSAGMAGGFGKQ